MSLPQQQHLEAFRRFNRFYTQQIGVLEPKLLDSAFTLTQARVLYELAQHQQITASEIGAALGLDAGYLSRILRSFEQQGLLARKRSREDRRHVALALTAAGRRVFKQLDQSSQAQASATLSRLSPNHRRQLLDSMQSVQQLLDPAPAEPGRVVIRSHRPGDLGWAIERHGQLYTDEYGWNEQFEALVAGLFAAFATQHDPATEHFWVAEVDGRRVGCVFLVRNADDADTAQLRCLLVDPAGRGLGVGRQLVDRCIRFARAAGYRRMMLWTNDVLVAARRIYEAAGFTLSKEYQHHSFGHDLTGQIWTLELRATKLSGRTAS